MNNQLDATITVYQ